MCVQKRALFAQHMLIFSSDSIFSPYLSIFVLSAEHSRHFSSRLFSFLPLGKNQIIPLNKLACSSTLKPLLFKDWKTCWQRCHHYEPISGSLKVIQLGLNLPVSVLTGHYVTWGNVFLKVMELEFSSPIRANVEVKRRREMSRSVFMCCAALSFIHT